MKGKPNLCYRAKSWNVQRLADQRSRERAGGESEEQGDDKPRDQHL